MKKNNNPKNPSYTTIIPSLFAMICTGGPHNKSPPLTWFLGTEKPWLSVVSVNEDSFNIFFPNPTNCVNGGLPL